MKRILSIDLARGFTVIMMPSIHVVMLYSKPEVQNSLLGDVLGFIAEGPGAQLFMMIMGISFVYSSRISAKYVLRRVVTLLIAGYALNFLKFVVPLELGWMPANLIQELQLGNDYSAIKFFMTIGDILQFAAISYAIIYLVSRLKHFQYYSALIAIVISFVSPYLWDLKTGISMMDHIIVLFNGHPPFTFFPVLPWLVYPLVGLTIGHYLKQVEMAKVFKRIGLIGIALLIFSLALPATPPTKEWLAFYRTGPADTIFHIGFILLWLALIQWLSVKWKVGPLFRLLEFSSQNITIIYLVQWILICWCMGITGYLQLNFQATIIWLFAVSVATFLLTFIVKKLYAQSKNI